MCHFLLSFSKFSLFITCFTMHSIHATPSQYINEWKTLIYLAFR
jgi:hypothetical protein